MCFPIIYKNCNIIKMTTPATLTSSPHFDLNSMLNLQKFYAHDLTKIKINPGPAGDDANDNAIKGLTAKLNSMSTNVSDSQAQAHAVLFKQKIVNNILETESDRLDAKKANIDTAMQGQKRMIALNNNYQKRYAAYTKIMIAITVGLVIYIFMDRLMALMPFIPELVFYIIIIVILGGIIFYCYLVWIDVKRRELTNFDEIALPAPDLSGTPTASSSTTPSTTPSGAGGPGSKTDYDGCVGQDCCGYDAEGDPIPWSPTTGCSIR